MVNVKHPLKGRNTLNPYALPIDSINHVNLQFLCTLGKWLECWFDYNKVLNEGFPLIGIVEVAKYLL